jgi:hypothetical protein
MKRVVAASDFLLGMTLRSPEFGPETTGGDDYARVAKGV